MHFVRNVALVIVCFSGMSFEAQARSVEQYCAFEGFGPPLRHTMIVIDGALVVKEDRPDANSPNAPWRSLVARLLEASDVGIRDRFAPRERVTVAVAHAGGAGLAAVFSGCLPFVSAEEAQALDARQNQWDAFVTGGWQARAKDAAETFRRQLVLALVEAAQVARAELPARVPFSAGGLVAGMAAGPALSLDALPRYVAITDFGRYEFPAGTVPELRARGRADAEAAELKLERSETHVIDIGSSAAGGQRPYVEALFLAGGGLVETVGSAGVGIKATPAPQTVEIFQGTIKFPDGEYPVRMRLALDRNGETVNSWI